MRLHSQAYQKTEALSVMGIQTCCWRPPTHEHKHCDGETVSQKYRLCNFSETHVIKIMHWSTCIESLVMPLSYQHFLWKLFNLSSFTAEQHGANNNNNISNKNLEESLVKSSGERGRASVALESAWLRRGHWPLALELWGGRRQWPWPELVALS